MFGLYLLDDMDSILRRTVRYKQALEQDVLVLSFYSAWGFEKEGPDLEGIEKVLRSGFIPMITWEPWRLPRENEVPEDQPGFSLQTITSGKHDDYISYWAFQLKEVSGPVLFRPMHEMNGNWYPWCGRVNGNCPEDYVCAWRHIRDIFREVRNDRLTWVWSPYVHSVPCDSGNEIWRYYPGTKEVDWVAMDGYNWGSTRQWSSWQSFEDIFRGAYEILNQLSPEKPIMIAEMGCAEEGGSKERWIEEAFRAIRVKYPRIRTVVWFNTRKECDWRIESSLRSFEAFRKGLKGWLS